MKEVLLSIPSPFGPPITLYKNSWEGNKSPDNILSIVSGLHGDQVNGIYINSLLTRFLDRVVEGSEPDYNLKGKVQIFPVVNILAAQSGSRVWSFDDLDIDLAFPGNDKGEVTERIARAIFTHTSDSTHAVILKTADHLYEDAAHIQMVDPDRPTKKMAESLGLDIARKLPESTTFQLSLFGHWRENDIPCLMVSAGKSQTLDKSLCDSLFTDLVDMMAHIGVLSTDKTKKEITKLQIHPANAEQIIISSHAGLFVAEVAVGSFLQKGQKLGEMKCVETGETLEKYAAPVDGYLVTLRHYPLTFEKESIATVLIDKKPGFWPF
jgi:predicted deacylase